MSQEKTLFSYEESNGKTDYINSIKRKTAELIVKLKEDAEVAFEIECELQPRSEVENFSGLDNDYMQHQKDRWALYDEALENIRDANDKVISIILNESHKNVEGIKKYIEANRYLFSKKTIAKVYLVYANSCQDKDMKLNYLTLSTYMREELGLKDELAENYSALCEYYKSIGQDDTAEAIKEKMTGLSQSTTKSNR